MEQENKSYVSQSLGASETYLKHCMLRSTLAGHRLGNGVIKSATKPNIPMPKS